MEARTDKDQKGREKGTYSLRLSNVGRAALGIGPHASILLDDEGLPDLLARMQRRLLLSHKVR